MRVALLTSANGWRGSGVSYAKIARGLRERGHAAHLVTTTAKLTDRFRAEGLAVTQIPGHDAGPREVLALRHALAKMGAQAIVTDTPRDVRLSFYATLLHRARIVYRYNLNHRRPRTHVMDRVYLSRVSACIYQSRYILDDAVASAHWMARIPAYHIPNGYDTVRFRPRPEAVDGFRERYAVPLGARVVLTAAKLTPNKGQEIAIAALDRVRRQGIDLVYVLCGEGPGAAELLAMARERALPAVFTGLVGTEEMIAAYSAADLVVHPSLQEIFPNVVGEAMACARPIVAADAGGTGELLGRDGIAGALVPPFDPDALASAVRDLLLDPERLGLMGQAARRRIEEEFPVERMIERYERALTELVGSGA